MNVQPYRVMIAPVRGHDGVKRSAMSWEVAVRGSTRRILGCGTALSRAEAEAKVRDLVERHRAASIHLLA